MKSHARTNSSLWRNVTREDGSGDDWASRVKVTVYRVGAVCEIAPVWDSILPLYRRGFDKLAYYTGKPPPELTSGDGFLLFPC